MKKQFKPGDLVRLKKNLKVGESYGIMVFINGMKFIGEKKVREVTCVETLMLDMNPYYYSKEMSALMKKAQCYHNTELKRF